MSHVADAVCCSVLQCIAVCCSVFFTSRTSGVNFAMHASCACVYVIHVCIYNMVAKFEYMCVYVNMFVCVYVYLYI